jgi:hypothetical protein
MRVTGRNGPKHRMDVHHADRLEGATIEGIAVTDPLAYWRAGDGAKSA